MKLLPVLAWTAALGTLLAGCGPDDHGLLSGGPGDKSSGKDASVVACQTPQEGCACEQEGEVVDCGQVDRRSGDYVSCSMGQRVCKGGAWGACVGDRIASSPTTTRIGSSGLLALGTSTACLNNPCDPYCVNYLDNGKNLDGGSTLANKDGGVTLIEGTQNPSQTTCTGMTLSPTPQTITVTSITPLVTNPPNLQYTVQLTPPGCSAATVPAAWTNSDNDICVIDPTGLFTVYAPVAAAVQMTAYVATWQATAVANIHVDVHDTTKAPAGTAALFVGAGAGTDNFTILYPYASTVFPRALAAPVLQWDNLGVAAQAVKISLRYPATGTATFNWSTIIPETATPQATIPQDVWTAFDQTGKAQDAIFGIQRVVGGVLMPEKTRTIHFSATPLRGLIYYTEYGRGPSSPAPSPTVGGSCSLPTLNATVRALDPTTPSAPVNPFATIAPGGCPVCHSVSANGNMFVTSNRGWGPGGGVSKINPDGTFTLISDAPQPPKPGTDSRGYAFAAISPDGQYVLQGSNLWGNTKQPGSVGAGYRLSGGNGYGLQADYFSNQTLTGTPILTQVDQYINNDWGAGSPDPSVPTDHFSVRWTGFVEPYSTETYTFTTETDEGVRLWVNDLTTPLIDHWVNQTTTQWSATIALTAGVKYAFKLEYYENTGNAVAKLHWSSPTTTSEIIPEMEFYPPPQPPTNNGLNASYFNWAVAGTANSALAQPPDLTRIDPNINFDWGGGSPGAPVNADNFSVRWTGFVKPVFSETYTFETTTDDGVRIWVNGLQLVNNWNAQGANAICGSPEAAQYSGSIALTAGTKYPITVEYFEQGGGASAKLYWQSASTPCAPVPKNRLFQW